MTDRAAKGPPPGSWPLLRRFWVYVRPHRHWLLLGLAMIPVVAGMTALRPLLLKQAVDVDIPAHDVIALRVTALLFLLAVAAEFLAQAAQVYALQRVGHATINDLRRAVFQHVLRLPARFFDAHPLGSLLSRSTSDIEALSETLAFGVFTILLHGVVDGDLVPLLRGARLRRQLQASADLQALALRIDPGAVRLA